MDADEATQRITIREKSTGKTVTVTLDELKEGRITFTDDKGEEFNIEASGEGESGSIRIRSGDGETVFSVEGGKTPEFPSWAPVPQGEFTGAQRLNTNEVLMVSGTLRTNQTLEDFAKWLEAEAKSRGFTVTAKNVSNISDGEGPMFTATSGDKKESITAMGGKKTGEPVEIIYSVQEEH